MNEELLSILRSARRKLVATRALESAAAMTIVAAAFYVAAQAGTLLGRWHPRAGFDAFAVLACAVLLLCLVLLGRREYLGSGSLISAITWFFGCFLTLGAIVGIIPNCCRGLPSVCVPAAGMLLGAAFGAASALLRRQDLRTVATLLDAKGHLRERLSTAAELALSKEPLPPSAPVVFGQALAALKERRPQRLPMWSASAALPAGVALALAVCLALAFLPEPGSAAPRQIDQISQAVPTMTADQRQRLAEAFRQEAANQQAAAPAISAELLKAAAIVEVKDAQELEQILLKLQKAGFAPLAPVPPDVLAAAGLRAPATQTAPPEGGTQGSGTASAKEPNQPPGGGYVSVYDPRYAAGAPQAGEEPSAAPATPRPEVPYADAWAAARARAADQDRRGEVPLPYRRLVRDFFATAP